MPRRCQSSSRATSLCSGNGSSGLTLKSADGTDFSAFYATSDIPQVGVVILPDVRGLHPFYGALAERFAEAGLATVAIDYFARTAGMTDSGWRPEDFDRQTHIKDANHNGRFNRATETGH